MPSNSPNFGTPPPNQPLLELLEDNPQAFGEYLRVPRDTRFDTKDGHQTKKDPTRSGVPGLSA